MRWEPGCREVPAGDDPPDYQPPDDDDWWHAAADYADDEQDEAELRWESYYHPGEGDRGGPDGAA